MRFFILFLIFCHVAYTKAFGQIDTLSLYKKAEQKFKDKEYAFAIDYLNKHLQKNKKDAKAYFLKGLAEFKAENPLGALKCFDSAIYHKKDYLEAYYNRASLLQGFGRVEEALRDYNLVIKASPNIPIIRQERGKIFYIMQKMDSARSDFLYALRIKIDMWESALFLGKIYNKKKEYQKAIICLDTAQKYQPNYTEIYLVKAQAYTNASNIPQALKMYDKVFELNPYSYYAYFERGKMFFAQKQYKNALPDFEKITLKEPKVLEYWLWLAKNYLAMKEKSKACEALQKAELLEADQTKKDIINEIKKLIQENCK